MLTIQWRPALNALTTPKSYRIQAVSGSTDGYDEMAADISAEQLIYSEETVKGLAPLIMQWIQRRLINGSQVTLPDAPLPESDDLLQVNVRISQPFVKEMFSASSDKKTLCRRMDNDSVEYFGCEGSVKTCCFFTAGQPCAQISISGSAALG